MRQSRRRNWIALPASRKSCSHCLSSSPCSPNSPLLTDGGKASLARYERDVLEKLVLRRIQLQEASKRGLAVDKDEVAQLLAQGYSPTQYREDIARAYREKLLIAALKAAVIAEGTVAEEEIESYYGTDPTRFVDEAGKMLPLEAVRDRIAAILRTEKGEAHGPDWLAKAREGADVEINL